MGGQQLVAENEIIDLGNYFLNGDYYQSVDINKDTKTITGAITDARINVNNGELISEVLNFFEAKINIQNNSNATFKNEVYMLNPNFHINDSTAVFNKKLEMQSEDSSLWHVNEQDNNFSGGDLSLNNSTLDIEGEDAIFTRINALINHGSTAKTNYLVSNNSKIYVVNNSKLEINKDATFGNVRIYVANDSKLKINNAEFYDGAHLIVKDDSNATINDVLNVNNSGTIEFVDGEYVVNYGGIKIDKSNLNVEGEAHFHNSDTELNNSSNANFKDKLTLIDSAMLLKNGSTLDVGGVAYFENSALVVQNGSKALFNDKFTMKNIGEKSIIILDNGSEINVKGDFENHGVIYYGASADS
ncbi:MAG: hypothetical protein IKK93_01810, partial [Campylobacter sp.]|nr:hypothetical protein [Campylobacter sp.]